ncbi:hypothetical protein [Desulfolutivibrio sulfoxidireducens]|uniref:hypothetical protein n=1 Tax=Desulfolutivibrio sulfoxidireducens TaxID=2773299 RepID=UPI00159DEB54|nr:hypothetical protein [Desulfolutivibrio sulfoxidireducens]QLA16677.1 hypothetical protein GD605_11420 [Desulfolutivibrio sulfoxidireducens]QLA19446.1 hypothetical protein GD604_06665 [Desulfolutivibrio sulfoxidireducens]
MKKICSLCGQAVPEMDFYVRFQGGIACGSCIVERGVRVAGTHAGPDSREDVIVRPPGFGRLANLAG